MARSVMNKHTILFLAANPAGTPHLALDQEARAIQAELERSGHRDQFDLVTRWAAQPLDLLRELRKLRPTIVHFSGHGGSESGIPRAGVRRDVGDVPGSSESQLRHGLFFQGPDGRPQLVSTEALEATFGAAGASVKLVVLSACYSEPQAEALLAHVDCVVGMGGSILDDAARNFAIGFYGGLGERESVAAAFLQGRAAISLEGLRDSDRPELKVRIGVDPKLLVLADLAASGTVANADRSHGTAPPGGRATHSNTPAHATRDVLLTRLMGLLPSQFDVVLFRAAIPPGYLSGGNASQTTRAVDAIRYLEQQDKLERLAQILDEVAGAGNATGGRNGSDPR
ncbi:MAG: CHAT domain-containing protein [Deltaproteobacteria bacterium]|nr:MAG: CHAT domain-containing protein [Deltaproteobacteria bacterium]